MPGMHWASYAHDHILSWTIPRVGYHHHSRWTGGEGKRRHVLRGGECGEASPHNRLHRRYMWMPSCANVALDQEERCFIPSKREVEITPAAPPNVTRHNAIRTSAEYTPRTVSTAPVFILVPPSVAWYHCDISLVQRWLSTSFLTRDGDGSDPLTCMGHTALLTSPWALLARHFHKATSRLRLLTCPSTACGSSTCVRVLSWGSPEHPGAQQRWAGSPKEELLWAGWVLFHPHTSPAPGG